MKKEKIVWKNIRLREDVYEKLAKKAYIKRLTLSELVRALLTEK